MPHNLHILSNATGDCAASAGVSADCLPVWLYLPLCLCVCVWMISVQRSTLALTRQIVGKMAAKAAAAVGCPG